MSRSCVTIDLGNSRAKLRRWRIEGRQPAALVESADATPRAGFDEPASARLLSDAGIERVALSSVAEPQLEQALVADLRRRFGARFVGTPDPGLLTELRAPERAGRDRLFAARGALALERTSALVIDAGTCVTVDALRVGADGRGLFLGGAIAPGPRLLAEALARGGARLQPVEPRPGVPALGRDTEAALLAGVVVGLRGAVRELVRAIGDEAGLEQARLVWTGGARALLLDPALLPERRSFEVPDLVHLGLLAALSIEVRMSLCVRELTPPGAGAVSVLELSGAGARALAEELVRRPLPLGEPVLARLMVGEEFLDEVLVCARADAVELHLHGSPALVRRVCAHLVAAHSVRHLAGRTAPAGALEERALALLPEAPCAAAARMLLDQAQGVLRAALEAWVASAPAERERLRSELLERARVARYLLRPARVVLAGPVNAGKSTLFNVLLGRERAITSTEEGTTRDVLRESAQLGDWPVELVDTAGVESRQPGALERAGQERARAEAQRADLVLWLVPPGGTPPASPAAPNAVVRVLHSQADREPRAGAFSALARPLEARALVQAELRAALALPERAWTRGAAVPFEPELAGLLRALDAGAEAGPLRERLAPWLARPD